MNAFLIVATIIASQAKAETAKLDCKINVAIAIAKAKNDVCANKIVNYNDAKELALKENLPILVWVGEMPISNSLCSIPAIHTSTEKYRDDSKKRVILLKPVNGTVLEIETLEYDFKKIKDYFETNK